MTDNLDEFAPPVEKKKTMPKGGRPKGAKNKSTLLREALNQQFEDNLQEHFQTVLNAVVKEAANGNMVAAKMILDRIIPVHKAADFKKTSSGGTEIIINVGSLEGQSITIDADSIEDAEFEEEESDA